MLSSIFLIDGFGREPRALAPEAAHEHSTANRTTMFNCKLKFKRLQDESPVRPLGQIAEDCFGPAEVEGIRFDVIRALTNFYRLQFLVSMVDVDRIFSWEQRYSYQLLFDWWTAAFQDPSVPFQYFKTLFSLSPILAQELQTTLDQTRPCLFACIVHHTHALVHSHNGVPTELNKSPYNAVLSNLFKLEFGLTSTYNRQREDRPALLLLRPRAAREAYRQQVWFESFHGRRINPHLHDMSDDSRPCPFICSHQASDPSCPRTVQRGPLIRACSWLDPNTSVSGQYLSRKDEKDNDLAGWPEYLWDLEKGHAVRTKDLENKRPDYTAISHTWGRWSDARSGHLLSKETTPKDLFYPIPVSKMKDFNVENLVEDLRKLKEKVKTDYVWLDLVCLPQGIEGTQLSDSSQRLKKREIARQAWIFRNAKFAIAWLHDIQDLSCLEAVFKLYALLLADTKLACEDEKAKDKLMSELLERIVGPTGLLLPLDSLIDTVGFRESAVEDPPRYRLTASEDSVPERQASLWFTSLWTLQEVCLRPDMWLATANWSICSLDNDQHIPLNGFLCVRTSIRNYMDNAEKYRDLNSVINEIEHWSLNTGLSQLLELSRADIIRLGDRRYCKKRRAEAIMSALGATTWYSLPGNREADLILEKYPQSFVEEVRNLIPGEFFTAHAKLPHADPHDHNQILGGGFEDEDGNTLAKLYSFALLELDGSLLPFSLMGHRYIGYNRSVVQLDVHGSIVTWKIGTSGHVRITKACILSSSTINDIPQCPEILLGQFIGFLPGSNDITGPLDSLSAADKANEMLRVRDLHEWTRSRRGRCEVHLVLVTERLFKEFHEGDCQVSPSGDFHKAEPEEIHTLRGIVFRAVSDKCDKKADFESANGEPKKLVKIGCFWVSSDGRVDLPEAREVDWEVL